MELDPTLMGHRMGAHQTMRGLPSAVPCVREHQSDCEHAQPQRTERGALRLQIASSFTGTVG